DCDVIAVLAGVADEVGDAALERLRAHAHGRLALERDAGVVPRYAALLRDLLEQRRDVGGKRILAAVAAGKGKIALEHAVHGVDVGLERLDVGALLEEGELEAEPREDRAQVMADPGKHRRALLDL